jgi:hypothetical protein
VNQRPADRIETHFEAVGSIPRPAIVGRAVRLVFGLALLWAVYGLIVVGWDQFVSTTPLSDLSFWILIAFAFKWTPYVINIGFGSNWKRRPRYLIVGAILVLVVADLLVYGTWWAPPLGTFLWIWLLYFSAHLGISFVLSALIATPGCEMRALPHLWTILSGRRTDEHYCPGFLDKIDEWERERSQ